MGISGSRLNAPALCLGVGLLAACNGGSGAPPPSNIVARTCSSAFPGTVRCSAYTLSRSAQPNVTALGPADFQARYELPSKSKGSGQIVAVVDAYDNPNVASDLDAYRAKYGLGTAKFTKYNQEGQTKNYPAGSMAWGVEIDLDAEMVSASCPRCTIYLIEANSASTADLQTAEAEAVTLGAHIVSNSWACTGGSCLDKSYFDTAGVTYLGSAGSAVGTFPADFNTVVAVGGTILSHGAKGYTEKLFDGSSGGCVTGEPKPPWQHDPTCGYRIANDAAAVASNVSEYDSYGYGGWFRISGASVSAPLLAGVFGLAGDAKKQLGGRTFWQTAHHKDLYRLAGQCNYRRGRYTTCAGWGSPDGIGAF